MIAGVGDQDAHRTESWARPRSPCANSIARSSTSRAKNLQLPEGAIDWLINQVTPRPEVTRLVERLINHTVSFPTRNRAPHFPAARFGDRHPAGEVLTGNGILHGGATRTPPIRSWSGKTRSPPSRRRRQRSATDSTQLNERRADPLPKSRTPGSSSRRLARKSRTPPLLVSTFAASSAMLERELHETETQVSRTSSGERGSIEARHREAAERVSRLEAEVQARPCSQHRNASGPTRRSSSAKLEVFVPGSRSRRGAE